MNRLLLLLLSCLLPLSAAAEPDSFFLGNGRDGALQVTEMGRVVNEYVPLAAEVTPGSVELQLGDDTAIAAGDLILLHQTSITTAKLLGSRLNVSPSDSPGAWEFARVAGISGRVLTLTAPIAFRFERGAQVVRVPEYTDVTVEAGASLVAQPWDGTRGGIVAFLVQGTLEGSGEISASSAGFRGGLRLADASGKTDCEADEAGPSGAQRGEGIQMGWGAASSGKQLVDSGGTGGICVNGGGGGGSNISAGGKGGTPVGVDVGGLGGANWNYLGIRGTRFFFGGGGGAGHSTVDAAGAGGRGGGFVFVRAQQILGDLLFSAAGEMAAGASVAGAAGNGGGAGGSIHLRAVGELSCALLDARGGRGSNVASAAMGPGGGGSGGSVLRSSASGICPLNVEGGLAGGIDAAPGETNGAAPGLQGFEDELTEFAELETPQFISPADGETVSTRPEIWAVGQLSKRIALFVNSERILTTSVNSEEPIRVPLLGGLPSGWVRIELRTNDGIDYGPPAGIDVFVDTVPPPAPVITSPSPTQPINTPSVVVAGTAEPFSEVNLLVDWVEARTEADEAGNFSVEVPGLTGEGTLEIQAWATDRFGNKGPIRYAPFIRDITPPDPPRIDAPISSTAWFTGPLTVVGATEPGGSLVILGNGSRLATTRGNQETGEISFFLGHLGDGPWTLDFIARDAAGNESEPVSVELLLDSTPPSEPRILWPLQHGRHSHMLVLTGKGDDDATIELRLDGMLLGKAIPKDGVWNLRLDEAMNDGSYVLAIEAVDPAGHRTAGAEVSFVVDRSAPRLQWSEPPLGSYEANAELVFTFEGEEAATFCAVDRDAFVPCESPWSPGTLAPGSHEVVVRAFDEAHNGSELRHRFEVLRAPAPVEEKKDDGGGCSQADGSVGWLSLFGLLALLPRRRRALGS